MRMTVMMLTVSVMIVGSACAQDIPEPIDIGEATAFADKFFSDTSLYASELGEILDGDAETFWCCGNHDLSEGAANLFIMLPEPVTVGRMEVTIPIHPEPDQWPLRLVNMDVYGGAGDGGWAKIGEVRDNDRQPTFLIDLTPATVDRIRLRVLPRSEEVTGWARIADIRLYPPAEGVEPAELVPETIEISEEEQLWLTRAWNYYEHVIVRGALPDGEEIPTVEYDPEIGYLGYARSFLDTMIEHGTDRYGEVHSPQWAGILDLQTRAHPEVELPTVHCISDNQRRGDRILYGGNIQHDVMTIMAAQHISEITGEDRYRDAARDYLQFFLDNCTDTPTGLWPWGEHSGWDFFEERRDGRDVHHLLSQPHEFWELAWELNSEAVVREADGIINHVHDLNTFVYNRHADMTTVLPDPRPEELLSSTLDFANSGARFLRAWAFAYSKTGDAKYLDWSNRLVDHLQWSRIDGDGPLPVLSNRSYRPLPDRHEWGNTLLVGLSMLTYAPLIDDAETSERYERLGHEYLDVVAEGAMPEETVARFTTGRGMGDYTHGMRWAQAYRLTGDERFLEAARRIGAPYRDIEEHEIPDEAPLRAHAFGVPLNLMLDLYELDGDRAWLEAAEKFAQWTIERFYYNGLFRGTTDLWYHDSQLGASTVTYGLVRLHAALNDLDVQIPPNVYGF
ncbi:MAG: hypothetical protein ACOX9R_04460 [Armatimonadota bacterium]